MDRFSLIIVCCVALVLAADAAVIVDYFIAPNPQTARSILLKELKDYALTEGLDPKKFVIQSTTQKLGLVIFDVIHDGPPRHLLYVEVDRRQVVEFHRFIEEPENGPELKKGK